MKDKRYKWVFGPVPSRRLGRSLGVDLVPFKTCSYDCTYCQLGRTTRKTIQRKEYAPLESVVDDIRHKLEGVNPPDYITLSGSGEPTLCLNLDRLIRGIKEITDIRVAVLTNGSLLWLKAVREELLEADLVIPSLDAGDDAAFRNVNRPCPEITFEKMVAGIREFREAFAGKMWLEVFLLGGVTAMDAEVAKISSIVKSLSPGRVQLNTVVRPPCEDFAFAVPQERMSHFAGMFDGKGEVVADYSGVHGQSEFSASVDDVLDLLRRRPCTVEDVSTGLGLHRNEVTKHLQHLVEKNEITKTRENGRMFYAA